MIEKLKSLLLALLVCGSLLQSYYLAYSSPKLEPIDQTQYIETEQIGTQAEAGQLIFPGEMILHFGDSTHTVLYPQSNFYDMILKTLKGRAFDGLRVISDWKVNWNDLSSKYQSVEIRFQKGIPLQVLNRNFQIRDNLVNPDESIRQMWLVVKEGQEEVMTYFLNDSGQTVYEAVNANLTVKDVQKFVGLGQYLPRYHRAGGSYYVPDEPIAAIRLSVPFDRITAEQMENTLFVDPDVTRNILERDGTEIYTDGKRGLQIKQEQQWMTYTDPIAPVESIFAAAEDLYTSVQFINQHGGWNGTFRLDGISNHALSGERMIRFQQYVGSYPLGNFPIVQTDSFKYGFIQVTLQNGTVSDYQRSLVKLNPDQTEKASYSLMGGELLTQKLFQHNEPGEIERVFPAYRPELNEDRIVFTPVWAVRLKDGTEQFLL